MAAELSASSTVVLAATLSQAVQDLSSTQNVVRYSKKIALANGTGNNQANLEYQDIRTLATAGTEDLDLAGVLASPFGDVLTFTKVKMLYIENRSLVSSFVVGPAASGGFATPFAAADNTVKIPPGGSLLLNAPLAGFTVTATTGDKLTITHGGEDPADADYVVLVIGVGTSA